MLTDRTQYAINNFIMDQYFLDMQHNYHLKEEKDSGASDLDVTIKSDNLCIYNFDDKKKCNFLKTDKKHGMQKSVDHILFEQIDDGWRLHLIEMKSSVGYSTWLNSIKPKVRTSYLTSLAIADFLGIKITDIIAYTTYGEEKFSTKSNETNPRASVPPLGKKARNPMKDEWEKDQLFLELGNEFKIVHKRIKMNKDKKTGELIGELVIS